MLYNTLGVLPGRRSIHINVNDSCWAHYSSPIDVSVHRPLEAIEGNSVINFTKRFYLIIIELIGAMGVIEIMRALDASCKD